MEFSSSSPYGVRTHYFLSIYVWQYAWSIANWEGSPESLCSKLLLGLHHIDMIDQLTDWLATWLISVFKSTDTMWSKAPTLNHIAPSGLLKGLYPKSHCYCLVSPAPLWDPVGLAWTLNLIVGLYSVTQGPQANQATPPVREDVLTYQKLRSKSRCLFEEG